MSRTLLIDADILAYRATAAAQVSVDWEGDGFKAVAGNFEEACRAASDEIDFLMDELAASDILICLSDDVVNFRKSIDSTYKAKRGGVERPQHLYDMKDWLAAKWPSEIIPTLEADDLMGIRATEPHKGDRIMVSLDKDMRTVPALLCCPRDDGRKLRVESISELDAIRFHFWQTIVGDATDGYPGCPGVGPASPFAEDVLCAADELEAWDEVLMAYGSRGLDESAAVKQARLAFILRHGYIDGKRPILWLPPYDPNYPSPLEE